MELCCSSASPLLCTTKLSPSPSLCFSSSNSVFLSTGARALSWGSVSVVSRRRRTLPASRRSGGCRCLFGLGVPELVVIAGVAALVFGPKKLPEIGRSIGKTVKSFQEAAKEFETELKKEPEETSEGPSSVQKPNPVSEENEEKKFETSPSKDSA